VRYQKKEPFSVSVGNASDKWPRCEELRYVAGKALRCTKDMGHKHKGTPCEFPKDEAA
jgi:hypothetical protein